MIASLGAADVAKGCDCVEPWRVYRGADVATTSRLVSVEPDGRRAFFTYEVLRVWKDTNEFDLIEGDEITVRYTRGEASCGPSENIGERFGVIFYELDTERSGSGASGCGEA